MVPGSGPQLDDPVLKAAAGDNPKAQTKEIWRLAGVPLVAIWRFPRCWGTLAPQVQTSLGAIPGPAQVWEEAVNLHEDATRPRPKGRRRSTNVRMSATQKLIADGQAEREGASPIPAPTYYEQIWTSIQTVFFGFLIATVVAVPLGICRGSVAPTANAALNPLIQIFKPVSPLAWLPIVTMVVGATSPTTAGLPKSFLNLGHHRDALFAVADTDQHRAGCGVASTRTWSTSPRS